MYIVNLKLNKAYLKCYYYVDDCYCSCHQLTFLHTVHVVYFLLSVF